MTDRTPVPAAGVVCFRGADVLLIRRGTAPRLGEWSIPGGRQAWGERAADCALRELGEETGVQARLLGLVDVVDALFEDRHLVLVDYAARWISGEPQGADDAAEARFFPIEQALSLIAWEETRRVITAAWRLYGSDAAEGAAGRGVSG